jgi:hypothetical protein
MMLAPVATLALASCSSTSKTPGETTTTGAYQHGVPGGVTVETHKITANISAIDAGDRTVTLVTPDGHKDTVKCGPEIVNFDQLRVGDQVKVKVTEELVISVAPEGAPTNDGGAVAVVLAPKGGQPGGIVAATAQVTAKVTAIDLKRHKATILFPDGSTRTVAVRKDVDLTQRKVGEQVVFRVAQSAAISVEKP